MNDLVNQKFGRLIVLEDNIEVIDKYKKFYNCKCECGNIKRIQRSNLLSGNTKSCGCLSIENVTRKKGNNFINLTGRIFGKLTVLDNAPEIDKHRQHIYYCQCECGNKKWIRKDSLFKSAIISCGCYISEAQHIHAVEIGKSKFLDLTNQKFGRLLVVAVAGQDNFKRYRWLCRCECGREKIINSNNLMTGHIQSCGCFNSDSVKQRHKEYRISKGKDPDIFMDTLESLERSKFHESKTYQNILNRESNKCQFCTEGSCNLEIHHIKSWSEYPELRYEETNLITLCKICHIPIIHNGNQTIPVHEATTKYLQKVINNKYVDILK